MEARVISKVSRRIVPFVALCYFVCYLDRVNVGFAALEMNKDLGFTATMFGWGAGIFFFGYFFFEVPSNLALERFGARLWIARIMVTWGLLSAAMALIWNAWSFLAVRFLLEGYLAVNYGDQAEYLFKQYFPWIGLGLAVLIILIFIARVLWRKKSRTSILNSDS